MRSRGTFRFWKRAPSFTIGLTFRFADYINTTSGVPGNFLTLIRYLKPLENK